LGEVCDAFDGADFELLDQHRAAVRERLQQEQDADGVNLTGLLRVPDGNGRRFIAEQTGQNHGPAGDHEDRGGKDEQPGAVGDSAQVRGRR